MTPSVFNLNYLSLCQVSKVRTVLKSSDPTDFKTDLTFSICQVEAEILPKNKLGTFFVDMVYISAIVHMKWLS